MIIGQCLSNTLIPSWAVRIIVWDVYIIKLGRSQLPVALESGLGIAPLRKLQGVLCSILLGQTEWMLIKASNHIKYLRDVKYQEEYFLWEVISPLGGGSWSYVLQLYLESY